MGRHLLQILLKALQQNLQHPSNTIQDGGSSQLQLVPSLSRASQGQVNQAALAVPHHDPTLPLPKKLSLLTLKMPLSLPRARNIVSMSYPPGLKPGTSSYALYPHLAPNLLAYEAQICKLSRKFKASAWLMYDTAFCYMPAFNLSMA